MVPAAVVVMDAPAHGQRQAGHRALPAPEYRDHDRYRAPATAVEQVLADIYAEVLGIERVASTTRSSTSAGTASCRCKVVARARAAGA